MKSGKCPKCSSSEIYKRPKFSPNSSIAFNLFTQMRFQIYICSQCGYLEAYIDDIEELIGLTEKWKRV